MDDYQKIMEKEIDLIQSCINRMAQNSFAIKGWLITLVTVILALLPEKVDISLLSIVVIIATLCFWYLDAYYLRLERLYRWKYEWVIDNRLQCNDNIFNLDPENEEMWKKEHKKLPSIISVMFSSSILPLYGIIIIFSGFCFLNAVLF